MQRDFEIAVLPGDGIGVDVTREAVKVLQAVQRVQGGFRLNMKDYPCGAICYRDTGEDLPPATIEACRAADAVLLGAMGHPEIRKSDGTELIPQVTLRVLLDLFAGVRPCKSFPGTRSPLLSTAKIDLVLLREQTEGLFASQNGGIVLHDDVATDTLVMTRPGVTRICEFAFRLAQERLRSVPRENPQVTCVDKANIFKSFAFFRKIFNEVAATFPDIDREHAYIDAHALQLVQRPERYDVIVTENMFGDILSELSASLVGGMGMAPSGDIGLKHAVFQPAHGTAPDIAGMGIANPIAAILSAGMMLEWLGRNHEHVDLLQACQRIDRAVGRVLEEGKFRPVDQGGQATTTQVGDAIVKSLS